MSYGYSSPNTDPTATASSTSLSDVDLGEHIHRLSSLPSSLIPSSPPLPPAAGPRALRFAESHSGNPSPPRISSWRPPGRRSERGFGVPSIVGNFSPMFDMSPPARLPQRRLSWRQKTKIRPASATLARPNSLADDHSGRRRPLSERDLNVYQHGEVFSPTRVHSEETCRDTVWPASPSPAQSQSLTHLPIASHGLSRSVSRLEGLPETDTPAGSRFLSSFVVQAYTISYLIFFSILGTLARIGMTHLNSYTGAPVNLPVIWSNFTGTFILGFLIEDKNMFLEARYGHYAPTTTTSISNPTSALAADTEEARRDALALKKSIPLYIGLATGFCGSFTSFSSAMLDAFLSLSNNLPTPINHPYDASSPKPSTFSTVHRPAGYALLAVLGTLIMHTAIPLAALLLGTHAARMLDKCVPMLSFRAMRSVLDRAIVPLATLTWLATVILTIWPPDRHSKPAAGTVTYISWRSTALIALTMAPVGCILRYILALSLNGLSGAFPLGTFAANIFGTAVMGMAFDLQHAPVAASSSGLVGCQILQGVMDGFCGACTTVSTWCAEVVSMAAAHSRSNDGTGKIEAMAAVSPAAMARSRLSRAYVYGVSTLVAGLGVAVVVCGGARWTVGFVNAACV